MKIILSIIILFSGQLLAQTPVYNISIQSLDGKTINMADYKGKKIIVETISPQSLLNGQLAFLDSLQMNNPSVKVMALTTSGSQSASDSLALDSLKENASSHVFIGATNAGEQNSLLHWLTNISENTHFDADAGADSQLYMVSESGVLYAVLEKGSPAGLLSDLIIQADVKQ